MRKIDMNSSSKYHLYATNFLLFCYMSFYIFPLSGKTTHAEKSIVDVGLILDMDTSVGKESKTCMTMALEDFYAKHNYYTTRIFLHHRDSKSDVVEAASAAIDLLKNVQVQAILGPQRSTQADFVIDIGNKTRVPIISQATSPLLSPMENPYFVRAAQNSSSQVQALTDIFKAFHWHEVVLIYEDSNYGRGFIPFLSNNVLVKHRIVLSVSARDDQILQELYKLMAMQTRVFVVNMLPDLASRFFPKVKQAGMMSKGYAWIITDGLTSLLDCLDPDVIRSMQGVLGVKSYVPKSKQLDSFNKKWRKRFRQENPDIDRFEMNVFGLWAYDSVQALAMAIESSRIAKTPFQQTLSSENLSDLSSLGTSEMGPRLLQSIRNTRFKGLSGDFHLVDGELQPSDFEIVNVIGKGDRRIGFWRSGFGISKNFKRTNKSYTINKEDLGEIVWPGETNEVPRGWDFPTNEKKLRLGVPVRTFREFMKVDRTPQTNGFEFSGFCVDVFEEILNQDTWSYAVPYELIPFQTPDGHPTGDYNDLVYQIYLGVFDGVVGDVTILANRSNYVDFSLPYTESGVSMIVPIKGDNRDNAWIFMQPLTMDLWLTTVVFFIFTGFVVWVLEHRVNKEFRGPPREQVGTIFWFAFSTMVFAQKEKVVSNLSRFVVIVWVFLVLVLTSSYTASLTSMLTVQKLEPTVSDIDDLIRNGEYVGVQEDSFVRGFLEHRGFDRSMFRYYRTIDEFDEALSKGSNNGGVGAYVDELPYLRLLLKNYCTKYTMVGPTYKTAGFGFAFAKGSPIVPDISRAILRSMEDKMGKIERKWFGDVAAATCVEQTGNRMTSGRLTLDSFKGLFLIAGLSSLSSLIIFLLIFLYENRGVISSDEPIKQKLIAIAKNFDQHKEKPNETSKKTVPLEMDQIVVPDNIVQEFNDPHSPAISISNHGEGIFTQEEGFSTPETPSHEINIVGAANEESREMQ